MENIDRTGGCPFKKITNWIQIETKSSLNVTLKENQILKHKEYIDILKNSFQENDEYFINIQDHITLEDIEEFKQRKGNNNSRVAFINTKLKEYFRKGIIFHDQDPTARELALQHIGNLGINDVTRLLENLLLDSTITGEEILETIDKEIFFRMKNNVLVDSIIHLEDFPHTFLIKNIEASAQGILSLLKESFDHIKKRFSVHIIPQEFREPMIIDHMIDELGVLPQITFGCPIVNLSQGKVFRSFIRNFLEVSLVTSHKDEHKN